MAHGSGSRPIDEIGSLRSLRQPPQATSHEGTFLSFDLGSVRSELERARLEIEVGRTAEAEQALSRIVSQLRAQDTTDPEVMLTQASAVAALGDVRAALGDDRSANDLATEAVSRFEALPEGLHPRGISDYGIALHNVGRSNEAVSVLRQALETGESWSAVRFHLGLALLWIGQVREGERQLRLAAAAEPDSPLAKEAKRLLARLVPR